MLNVFDAAVNRIRMIFREFEEIVVSVSGGKDSTCMFYLVAAEAERLNRRFKVFYLDQEAEYQSTIDVIDGMMRHPLADPQWYQVPIRMTNATSFNDVFLNAWEPGKKWIREKSNIAIGSIPGRYPDRFYDFFPWYEETSEKPTAHLVGLRIFESMNRQRTMLKANGYKKFKWSTACKKPGSFRFYPIFDWQPRDIWKCIADNDLPYNRAYDRMVARSGVNLRTMRVSNLIHEQAFRSLSQLQEFEPETFDKLCERIGGVHFAATYAEDKFLLKAELPEAFGTWRQYRDYLLATTPTQARERFLARFEKQEQDEQTAKYQVKQLLLNDWEGSLPRTTAKASKLREIWWDRL